jgi:hypothetical protein
MNDIRFIERRFFSLCVFFIFFLTSVSSSSLSVSQERLSIGLSALAAARRSLALTVKYVHGRSLFHRQLGDLQYVALKLAELQTHLNIGTVFVDR